MHITLWRSCYADRKLVNKNIVLTFTSNTTDGIATTMIKTHIIDKRRPIDLIWTDNESHCRTVWSSLEQSRIVQSGPSSRPGGHPSFTTRHSSSIRHPLLISSSHPMHGTTEGNAKLEALNRGLMLTLTRRQALSSRVRSNHWAECV